ncbi:GNAT family N-acetyltransferase [Microvirga flavescens]|uniref:GNAT family N-acetyltransferase n=1 Tax=Microvirga flavescens TaxID=2249811 RepID=UPI000DD975BE|nr:GNAT family N-acetyltransferase [Microvirga flavescens]
MSDLQIRLAEEQDAPAVAALIRALDLHYVGPDVAQPLEPTHDMVARSMDEREGTRYALAFREGRAVGLACFALLRPGFKLSGLMFVKELFVDESARGQAVGAAMMEWLAAYARQRGITRIDLTTDAGNRGARAFYERLGGRRMDKVFYRFDLSKPVLGQE